MPHPAAVDVTPAPNPDAGLDHAGPEAEPEEEPAAEVKEHAPLVAHSEVVCPHCDAVLGGLRSTLSEEQLHSFLRDLTSMPLSRKRIDAALQCTEPTRLTCTQLLVLALRLEEEEKMQFLALRYPHLVDRGNFGHVLAQTGTQQASLPSLCPCGLLQKLDPVPELPELPEPPKKVCMRVLSRVRPVACLHLLGEVEFPASSSARGNEATAMACMDPFGLSMLAAATGLPTFPADDRSPSSSSSWTPSHFGSPWPGPASPESSRPASPCLQAAGDDSMVHLNVYDLGKSSLVVMLNGVAAKAGVGGAFHLAVEVWGYEWSYGYTPVGTGVSCRRPRSDPSHAFRGTLPLGLAQATRVEFGGMMRGFMMQQWSGTAYHMINNNCCHFAQALVEHLGVGPLPWWVASLSKRAEALTSPIEHALRARSCVCQ